VSKNRPVEFKRKVQDNNNSLMINIPLEIAEALDIKKKETLIITLENESIRIREN
jgi:antitoxin component of MazEF toxin-antitoxin module